MCTDDATPLAEVMTPSRKSGNTASESTATHSRDRSDRRSDTYSAAPLIVHGTSVPLRAGSDIHKGVASMEYDHHMPSTRPAVVNAHDRATHRRLADTHS